MLPHTRVRYANGIGYRPYQSAAQLAQVTRDLKEIVAMRQHAASVSKAQKDIQRLKQEIAALESDLVATGSTKTADDVQRELDQVKDELCVCLRRFKLSTSLTLPCPQEGKRSGEG